jgi:hypothetical protein
MVGFGYGFAALCLLCLFVAQSVVAGGVTLITHGFNSDVASWIVPMQGRIARYGSLANSNTTCYTVSITQNGQGQYVASSSYIAGTNPLVAASGELLIKLDWSTLSTTLGVSTINIATAATAALLSTNLIPDLGGHALAELPLHLVGHSRGASVVAETARLLGAQGIWVDHLTALDPVPVGFPYGDPVMRIYANVLYTDNYWQNIGSPSGQALAGAYNRRLTNLSGGSSDHSDVHLWYHGTIDFNSPITVDGATISSTERANWWTAFEQQGTNAGFRLSLIGGGNRLSTNEPAGAGNGRISDGVNRIYDFGAGLAANRTVLPANNGAWPNVILFSHGATNPVTAGAPLPVSIHYQSGTNSAAALAFALDRDANPYSGNETALSQFDLAATGTNNVLILQTNVPTDGSIVPGTYRLLASVTAAGRTRYFHAPSPVTILPGAPPPPWLTSLGLTNGAYAFRVNGQNGQTVVTEASSNLTQWVAVATNVLTSGSVDFTDPETAITPARYFRAVGVP